MIASCSTVGNRRSWTLLGPPTGVVVADDATPEEVVSALAEQGWRMLTTSPPVHSSRGTINYFFRRSIR